VRNGRSAEQGVVERNGTSEERGVVERDQTLVPNRFAGTSKQRSYP
jgi:hypothetical protein